VPFDIGPWEVVILLAVLALLFGSKGVPDVARRLGTGARELKDALGEVDPRRMLEPGQEERPKTPETPRKPDA
jgi:sec-independent protein translocase protein TatA